MKRLLITLLFSSAMMIFASAQCDKKFNLEADTVYQLQPDSTRGEEIPGKATIHLSKDSIHVIMQMTDGNKFELKGKNTSTVCKMNADYSNGRIDLEYNAVLYARGNEKNDKMFFTITSNQDRMIIVAAPESNMGDKLCFVISKKEEVIR